MLLYRIVDPGAGFRFENLKHAIDGQSVESFANVALVREKLGMRPGGFGIALTRAIADELLYNEAQNEVILIKYIAAPVAAANT
jgi:anti-sigma regulatory factor (Ser/Thr protein kinase)